MTEKFPWGKQDQTERTKRLHKEPGNQFTAQESGNKSPLETKGQEEISSPSQGVSLHFKQRARKNFLPRTYLSNQKT